MNPNIAQGLVFLVLYLLAYAFTVWSCAFLQRYMLRPLPFRPHVAGIGVIYIVATLYALMITLVLASMPDSQELWASEAAVMDLTVRYAVALVPCVLSLLLVGLWAQWRDRRKKR